MSRGLSKRQVEIVAFLDFVKRPGMFSDGCMTTAQIAERFKADPGSTWRALDSLERRGMVKRKRVKERPACPTCGLVRPHMVIQWRSARR